MNFGKDLLLKNEFLRNQLYNHLNIEIVDSKFMEEALINLIDARNVLKFSYCFLYYIEDKKNKTKRLFYDYLGKFEEVCEK